MRLTLGAAGEDTRLTAAGDGGATPGWSAYSRARAILSARSNSWVLIPKNVLHLSIQLVRSLIDEFDIASFDLSPRPFAQVLVSTASMKAERDCV